MTRSTLLAVLLLAPAALAAKPAPRAAGGNGKRLAVEALAKAEAELRAKIAASRLSGIFADALDDQADSALARAGCEKTSGSLRCPGRPAPVIEKAMKEVAELSADVDAQAKEYGARTPKELFSPRAEAVLELIERLPDGSSKEHFTASLRRLGADFRSRVAYEQAVGRLDAIRAEIEGALAFSGARL